MESARKIINRLCEQSEKAKDGMAEVFAELQRRKAEQVMDHLDGIDREFLRQMGVDA
jgi:hypothetical protein